MHMVMAIFCRSCPRVFLVLTWAILFCIILNMIFPINPSFSSQFFSGFIRLCSLCNKVCSLCKACFFLISVKLFLHLPEYCRKHYASVINVMKSTLPVIKCPSPQLRIHSGHQICQQGWPAFLLWLYLIN